MTKEVKIIWFGEHNLNGYDKVYSTAEAEIEIAKYLVDGWKIMTAGGAGGAKKFDGGEKWEETEAFIHGFIVLQKG